MTRDSVHLEAALVHENELGMVERRRQEVFSQESCWSKGAINREHTWLDRLEEVIKFYSTEGRLPKRGAIGEEGRLARWMNTQRHAKRCLDEGKPSTHIMTPERIAILQSMSWWTWDAWEAAWQSSFDEIVDYVKSTGEIPSQSHPTLGKWISTQRTAYKAWQARLHGETEKYKDVTNYMDKERARKLESIPGWSWDPIEDNWEANYQELLKYVAAHNKLPSRSHPTLGKWVNTQRTAYRAWQARLHGEIEKYKNVDTFMDEERARKLESIPAWSWDPIEDNWEANYQELVKYVAKHKIIPPQSHPTLGKWVNTQRTGYRAWQARVHGETEKYKDVAYYMDEERARKLESIPGWSWDPIKKALKEKSIYQFNELCVMMRLNREQGGLFYSDFTRPSDFTPL
jgi:hypothetical protein